MGKNDTEKQENLEKNDTENAKVVKKSVNFIKKSPRKVLFHIVDKRSARAVSKVYLPSLRRP
jgi:hypothetical protein